MTSGNIPQEVYVWQRVWTEAVTTAVKQRTPNFKQSVFLAAEISYLPSSNIWNCHPFQDPLQFAHQSPNNHGLAFRIQTNASQSEWSQEACLQVSEFIQQHLNEVATIQIDYDCPSMKLADYCKLIAYLRKKFPNKLLEITCLPDWLNYSEFNKLIQFTDRYIMQVHGVSGHGKGQALCNTTHTRSIAIQCAELGKPFLIALPTYRHAVSYRSDGTIKSIASEGHFEPTTYEIVGADSREISALIQQWQIQRPELMQGVIWYRLPVPTDRMNWTWDTFQKVRHGETIDTISPELKIITNENKNHQLILFNTSKQHIVWPHTIKLNWQSFCIAHQLAAHYSIETDERSKGMTLKWNKTTPYPISPGESINLGTFRFNSPNPNIETSTL